MDSFTAEEKCLFYPQFAHTLCVSHTDPLWIAWNCRFEFLEICGTWQGPWSQISRNLGSTDCNLGVESGHEPGKPSSEWRNLDALSLGFLPDLNDFGLSPAACMPAGLRHVEPVFSKAATPR